jgi:hypothetical protein
MTCATAWPQSTTATLSGTVSDPSRAAIPAATIIATSDETGLKKTARTDSEGRYTIPFLAPGVYTVTAASEGFNSSTRFGVRLEVAQGSLLDFSLALAGIQQAIQVTAEAAPLLNTDTSGVDATLENKLIAELPSAERSSLSFLNTLPGVIDTGFALATGETQNVNSMANGGPIGSAGNRNFFDSNFGVSGGGVSTNDVLLDGISNTSPDFNGMAISPPQDSVRELKVLSGVFSAEYGRSGGAVVSIASNAGGNKFRGTIYEYFQNGDLNANGWQRNRAGYGPDGVTPALARILVKRNQFGGSLGGPVTLPFRPRSQSTFFFFNYEGRRERNPYSKILTLPTEKMRKGDLSELLLPVVRSNVPLNADGTPPLFGQVYNPYGPLVRNPNGVAVRNTIPGNRLDLLPKCGSGPHTAACLDPVGLALMDYLPLPNQPGLTNNYLYSGTTNFGKNLVAGRVDKVLSEKHSLFGRFSLENRLNVPPNFLNSVASRARAYNDTFRNFTLNDIYVFTPRVINNFRYGYLLAHAHIQTPSELAGFDITTLGLPSYMRERASMPGFPMFSFAGGPENQGIAGEITGSQIGSSGGNNQPRDTTTLADAVTFVRGRLSLKTGIEYRLMRFFYNENANPVGSFAFTRTITRGPVPTVTPSQAAEAGSTMASLLGGIPNVASMDSLIPLTCYQYYGAAFVQADWRVRPKLMLKLGLRWDVETGTGESHRQVTNFDFQAKSQLNGRVSMPPDAIVQVLRPNFTDLRGLLSFPDGPNAETSFKRFAPRVGFAYRLNEKTTLRGGYGISFLPQSFEQLSAIGVVFTTRVTQNTDSSGQVVPAGQAAAQSFFLTDPFRGNLMTPPGNTLGADTLIGQSPTLVSATRRTSYVQQYNLVIQRLLPSRFVLDVAYVGSHGVRLPFPMLDVNQLPPAFLDFARQNYAAARDANGAPATSAATFFSQQVLNPFYGIVTDPGSPLFSRTVRRDQLLKPFPQYNEPQLSRPLVGASRYDALQISLRKSYSNGLSAVVSYSFSRLKDIGCSGSTNVACGGSRLEDIYNPASDYTISDIDVPHRFTSSFSYELPVGQKKAIGQHFGRMANALAGGYQISGSLMYQSGTPISVTAPGIGLAYGVRRADAVAGVSAEIPGDEMRANIRAGGFAFNPDAYSKPADYTLGNAPRNSSDTRRDPYKNVNLSILKNFSIREGRQRIQLRGEFLNAFNMVVFGTPGRDVSNRDVVQNGIVVQRGTFARVTTQGNQPRIIQLVLRYSF